MSLSSPTIIALTAILGTVGGIGVIALTYAIIRTIRNRDILQHEPPAAPATPPPEAKRHIITVNLAPPPEAVLSGGSGEKQMRERADSGLSLEMELGPVNNTYTDEFNPNVMIPYPTPPGSESEKTPPLPKSYSSISLASMNSASKMNLKHHLAWRPPSPTLGFHLPHKSHQPQLPIISSPIMNATSPAHRRNGSTGNGYIIPPGSPPTLRNTPPAHITSLSLGPSALEDLSPPTWTGLHRRTSVTALSIPTIPSLPRSIPAPSSTATITPIPQNFSLPPPPRTRKNSEPPLPSGEFTSTGRKIQHGRPRSCGGEKFVVNGTEEAVPPVPALPRRVRSGDDVKGRGGVVGGVPKELAGEFRRIAEVV